MLLQVRIESLDPLLYCTLLIETAHAFAAMSVLDSIMADKNAMENAGQGKQE
jgi:hypothetical protein